MSDASMLEIATTTTVAHAVRPPAPLVTPHRAATPFERTLRLRLRRRVRDEADDTFVLSAADVLEEDDVPPRTIAGRYVLDRALPGPPLIYAGRDRLEQRDVIVRLRPAAEHLRLQAEATRVLAARSSHLAAVHDVGVDGDLAYLAYEQPAGRTLAALLVEGEQSLPIALSLTSQLLAGLDDLHRVGALHGGVAPGQVWVGRDHAVVLCGLAEVPGPTRPPGRPSAIDLGPDLASVMRIFVALRLGRLGDDDDALAASLEPYAWAVWRTLFAHAAAGYESAAELRLALFAAELADEEPIAVAPRRKRRPRARASIPVMSIGDSPTPP